MSAHTNGGLRWAGIAAAVLLAVAGCGGSAERVIPFRTDLPYQEGPPPRRNVPPLPYGARFCAPPDATIRLDDTQLLDSLRTAYYLDVANVGAATCILRGRPVVEVRGTPELPVRIADLRSFVAGYPPAGPAWGLEPGGSASVVAIFSEGLCFPGTKHARVSLRFLLPSGDTGAAISHRACPPGPLVSVTPFMPPPLPEPEIPRWPLRAELELPQRVDAGATLEFRVRLTNESRAPFRFPYCPSFTVGTVTETLNCRPMGTLERRAHALFAMRLPIPASAQEGARQIVWQLATYGDVTRKITASGEVEVVRRDAPSR